MKANELESKDLMIGDLVYACIEEEIVGQAKYKIISKIRELKANGDFTIEFVGGVPDELDWQDGDDISWIEPVPLTAEILGKNKFSKSRLMGEQRHFTYYLAPSVSLLAIYDAEFSLHIGDCARYIKYIHQLQHVLRLCGIEKEIEL